MPEPKRHKWPVPHLPVGTMGVYTGYEVAGGIPTADEALPGDVCIVVRTDGQPDGTTDLPTWRSLRTGAEFIEFSPCFTPVQEDNA